MTSLPQRLFVAAGLAVVLAGTIRAAEPAIVAKARAYLGSDPALDGVTSIHFVGTLVTADPAEPAKPIRQAVEIIFQKPEQQRIQATSEQTVEVTAIDGYEAWRRIEDAADRSKWQQTLLGAEQIKHLRANTWENLSFFRGLGRRGGQIEDQGPAAVDGIACEKIAFIHGPNIVFYRFFDLATGRLVYTETESGATMREQGELRVAGVRFPKSLVQTSKEANGLVQTVTITFEKVMVNETFPASLFAMPPLSPR